VSALWKGGELPDNIVRIAEQWHVRRIRIEYTSNGAFDLLVHNIKALTKIPVEAIRCNRTYQAKRLRIEKLQTLVGVTPPLLSYDGHARWVNDMLDQVESFLFEKNKKRDRSRVDDMLDAIALLAGFR
jgi:hypothetical protein